MRRSAHTRPTAEHQVSTATASAAVGQRRTSRVVRRTTHTAPGAGRMGTSRSHRATSQSRNNVSRRALRSGAQPAGGTRMVIVGRSPAGGSTMATAPGRSGPTAAPAPTIAPCAVSSLATPGTVAGPVTAEERASGRGRQGGPSTTLR